MIVKRVGPVSAAKISGTLYAILGLFAGAVFSLIAMVSGFSSQTDGAGGMGAVIGAGSIIVFPILYGCIGFVVTLAFAALYNLLAGILGGIEVDLQ
jgi:hypothetical protein